MTKGPAVAGPFLVALPAGAAHERRQPSDGRWRAPVGRGLG